MVQRHATDKQHITIAELRESITKYFLPVFDPSKSIGAVAVNSGKSDQLEEGYKKLGFTVQKEELPTFEGEPEEGSEDGSGSDGSESGSESGSEGEPMEDVRSP